MEPTSFIKSLQDTFKLNVKLTDVSFGSSRIDPYNFVETEGSFGEKNCLLYTTEITVFNVTFSLKILTFVYAKHGEVLKLEISIHNELLQKEISSCRNFLQRKRNLNLAFDTLIKIAKLHETRRLICQTVFRKQRHVTVRSSENGVVVKCNSPDCSVKYLEVNWSLSWNLDECEISDFIEFYCNYLVLEAQCGDRIRGKLAILVRVDLDFHSKFKIWKSLMEELYKRNNLANSAGQRHLTDVLEISDSDSDDSITVTNFYIDQDRCTTTVKDEILIIE